MTNVMITGGTGFIGHNVVLDLLGETNWDFTIVDAHTYAGAPEKLTTDPRYQSDRVKVVTHDLANPLPGPQATHFKDKQWWGVSDPDIIFNIASNSHVDNSIDEPAPFISGNVALMINMLEYARRLPNLRQFVQFSTDEVYGAAPIGVNFKEWATILPSNPYAASKAAQEAIAISYWRTYGVPLIITNTMNVLGKSQHPEKFIPKTVQHLLAGKRMTVHAERLPGDFNSWRAGSRFYTYVSNISSALEYLSSIIPARYGDGGDRPDRYNVVGDREVFNDEMVDLIATLLGVEPLKEYVDFHSQRPGHDRRYALSGRKLAELGWTAPTSFEEGLKITVESAMGALEGVKQ